MVHFIFHTNEIKMDGRPRGDARKYPTQHGDWSNPVDDTWNSFQLSGLQRDYPIGERVLLLHSPGRAANGQLGVVRVPCCTPIRNTHRSPLPGGCRSPHFALLTRPMRLLPGSLFRSSAKYEPSIEALGGNLSEGTCASWWICFCSLQTEQSLTNLVLVIL